MTDHLKIYYSDSDPATLGADATENDALEYEAFVEKWLKDNGYENTVVESYSGFLPSHLTEDEKEEQNDICQSIWNAFCQMMNNKLESLRKYVGFPTTVKNDTESKK